MTGPEDGAIRRALERSLGRRVAGLQRAPSPYATSHPLDELVVELTDGTRLELLRKDLGAPRPAARAVKPAFVTDPLREIEAYTRLLAGAQLPTPRCYGTEVDPATGACWLFLERVAGVQLADVGPRASWEHVARELARMHAVLAPRSASAPRLLRYEADLLWRWPARAAAFATPATRPALERIASGYAAVVARILAWPAGPIHGEYYASNVLVDDPSAPGRVCPVDWEMAAVGPGLLDLAALVSGRWTPADRAAIAAAYRGAAGLPAGAGERDFQATLDACRLHVALQWLGWAAEWSAPPEHATDWLADAIELARVLGL